MDLFDIDDLAAKFEKLAQTNIQGPNVQGRPYGDAPASEVAAGKWTYAPIDVQEAIIAPLNVMMGTYKGFGGGLNTQQLLDLQRKAIKHLLSIQEAHKVCSEMLAAFKRLRQVAYNLQGCIQQIPAGWIQ